MTRSSLLLALLLAVLCCPRPALAAARQLDWRLVYRVAPGCPEADAFLARLDEHVADGGGNYLDGSIIIVRSGERSFHLLMQFNGGRLEELESEDCASLVDAAVNTAGLARTDSPSARVETLLRRGMENASVAWNGEAHPAPLSLDETSPAPPVSQPPPAGDGESNTSDPTPGSKPVSNAGPWQPSVLGQALYVAGALPQPAFGAGLALAVSHRGLQARLEGTLWPSQSWNFLQGPRPVAVSLRQRSVALGICSDLVGVESSWGVLALAGCLRAALVDLESLASPEYSAGSTQYGTFGSRVGLTWQYAGLVVELLGGLDVPSGRHALGPASDGDRFVVQSSLLSASLALGWRWGSSGSEKDVASAE